MRTLGVCVRGTPALGVGAQAEWLRILLQPWMLLSTPVTSVSISKVKLPHILPELQIQIPEGLLQGTTWISLRPLVSSLCPPRWPPSQPPPPGSENRSTTHPRPLACQLLHPADFTAEVVLESVHSLCLPRQYSDSV